MTLWFKLQDLSERVQVAEDAGRTVGLDEVKALLDEADEFYDNGEYMKIINIMGQVDWDIQILSIPEPNDNTYMLVIEGALVLSAAVFIYTRRKTPHVCD